MHDLFMHSERTILNPHFTVNCGRHSLWLQVHTSAFSLQSKTVFRYGSMTSLENISSLKLTSISNQSLLCDRAGSGFITSSESLKWKEFDTSIYTAPQKQNMIEDESNMINWLRAGEVDRVSRSGTSSGCEMCLYEGGRRREVKGRRQLKDKV